MFVFIPVFVFGVFWLGLWLAWFGWLVGFLGFNVFVFVQEVDPDSGRTLAAALHTKSNAENLALLGWMVANG